MPHPLIETNFTTHGPYFDTAARLPAFRYTCKRPECKFYVVVPSAEPLSQETETSLLLHLSNVHVEQPLQGDFPESQNIKKYIDAGSAGMQHAARRIVQTWFNDHRGDAMYLTFEETFVVWFAKVLQNFKVLVSTTVPDLRYYEVTFNGDKNVFYLDVYKKEDNQELNG